MNKQDKLNLDPGLKQIVEDYWKEKWQYFARQQDESDREYVRAFKEELIDLVAKAAQYQKEQITEYQSKHDVQKLVEASRSIIKNKETAKQFLLLSGIIDEDGNLSEHYR